MPRASLDRTSQTVRVLQIVLSLEPGGTERLVIDIVRRLRFHAIDSVVCCLESEGAWAAELVELGVPVVALHRQPGFRPGVAWAISRLIAAHEIKVVHAHHYSSFVYGQLGAVLAGATPVVFTEHGRLSDAPPATKRRLVNPLLGRIPTAIFAVSDDLRRHMIAEGLPPERVQVLHNGIDPGPPITANGRRDARAALSIGPDDLIVGTVARLDPVKDLVTLIDGFHALHKQIPTARLVIIGDGEQRTTLLQRVAELRVTDAVNFTGHRQDVRALMPAFDIYANSSIHEGLSVTILEAMAASLPVVATQVGGNPEVVNANTGVLVPCRDATALGTSLLDLAADPARRARMGQAARARVESAFSSNRMVARYVASYQIPEGIRSVLRAGAPASS